MSFKDLREALLLSYEENTISDEEFLLLNDKYSSKNPEFEYSDYERFDSEVLNFGEFIFTRFRAIVSHNLFLSDAFLLAENGFVTIISPHNCISCASDHSMDELKEKQTFFKHFTNHNKPRRD